MGMTAYDEYVDLMNERDRLEEQNSELNVENQELRAQLEDVRDQLHKMTEQRDGWSIIARQFARSKVVTRRVFKMTMQHLRKQTKDNVELNMLIGSFIDKNLTDL